jgi:hypothetical protein
MSLPNELGRIISDTPPLPDDLYTMIERDLRSGHSRNRLFFATAAVLLVSVLSITFLGSTSRDQKDTPTVLHPNVTHELQMVSDYLNADDIETFTELSTLVDSY